jgi:membrane-bound lytic murein transglycosylase A
LGLCILALTTQGSYENNHQKEQLRALKSLQSFPIAEKKVEKPPKMKRNRGKIKGLNLLPEKYNKTDLSNFALPLIDDQLTKALKNQLKLLALRKQSFNQEFGNISLNMIDLETTIDLLLLWQNTYPQGLQDHLDAYMLKGRDGKGHVYFTGYYTPEIKVSKKPTKRYKYPLYAYPKKWEGDLPTRKEIDGDTILKGAGLEIAYAKKLEDIYFMQLQGSGLGRYPNGESVYFGFAGSNRHSYSSIGRFIKNNENIPLKNISVEGIKNYLSNHPKMVEPILFSNPSYVFFKKSNSLPKGAGHVPLTEDYSIAVDIKHLPLGSCLLAALPVLDERGKFSHHKYQFLVAQDVGGAIRGNGHVDVYCGTGVEGKKKAMALHHYGQLWLLLPKPSPELGPVLFENSLSGTEL